MMNRGKVKWRSETNKISQGSSYIGSFAPETKCDSRLFREEIWPVFYHFICDRDTREMVFDLNNVDFISPHVLTKLCCFGMIANRYGKKVEMLFNPVSKIKDYLGQMNFFTINEKHGFIYIDEGLTGGEIGETGLNKIFLVFDKSELLEKYSRLYTFSSDLCESDRLKFCIRGEIFGSNNPLNIDEYNKRFFMDSPVLNVLKELYSGKIKENYEFIKIIGLDFVEIIHNSLWHGGSKCFLAMQTAKYGKKKEDPIRVDISFADSGVGLYRTMSMEKWSKENKTSRFIPLKRFLSLKNTETQNYYSSLEAILFRKNERIRGLYDVLQSLLGKNPAVTILNRNSQMYLDEDRIQKLLREDRTGITMSSLADIGFGLGMDISFGVEVANERIDKI